MDINIIQIVVIIILAGLAYWANGQLNKVPVLVNVVNVIIVLVAVLLLLQSLGIGTGSGHYHINT